MIEGSPVWEEGHRTLGTGDEVCGWLSEDEGRRGEASVDSGRGTEVGDWEASVLQADGIGAVDCASSVTDPESCLLMLSVCAGVSGSMGSFDGPVMSVMGKVSFNGVAGKALSQRGSES